MPPHRQKKSPKGMSPPSRPWGPSAPVLLGLPLYRGRVQILGPDPMRRAGRTIERIPPLRDDTLERTLLARLHGGRQQRPDPEQRVRWIRSTLGHDGRGGLALADADAAGDAYRHEGRD